MTSLEQVKTGIRMPLAVAMAAVICVSAFAQEKPARIGRPPDSQTIAAPEGRARPVLQPAPAPAPTTSPPTMVVQPFIPVARLALRGWVDLHAHPMIHLALGGKLVHGGVDEQTLLATNVRCQNWLPAGSVDIALSDDRPSHGGWNISYGCGDQFRRTFIAGFQAGNHAKPTAAGGNPPANGWPNFQDWPAWNDITHQKMWWEWIRRARDGGQRVMVALATNNRTVGDAVNGLQPTDDKGSALLQIDSMNRFALNHGDFIEVALSPAHLSNIVRSNRIAMVLGVELDNLGNINQFVNLPMEAQKNLVRSEIQLLYDRGVRYIIPIHIVNNPFGGSAIYQAEYNLANLRETTEYFNITCSVVGDGINFIHPPKLDDTSMFAALVKLGLTKPFTAPTACPRPGINEGRGHRNSMGLTDLGIFAIKEMMRRGIIVDIDHMSDISVNQALTLAESIDPPRGYPITSGHSGIRGLFGNVAENSRSRVQLLRIAKLHGMFGLGSDAANAIGWSNQYQSAMNTMGYATLDPALSWVYQPGAIAFGSDLNGFVKGPVPPGRLMPEYDAAPYPMGPLALSRLGNKQWDYIADGVAHYGLLPDFIRHVSTTKANSNLGTNPAGQPFGVNGTELVNQHLMLSADYFLRMWERIEAQKTKVPL